mmetsp:Transcript_33086/g.77411  ORF Transcript_33086/g.77411 Transcript_33086/m.77411 type:complete len:310 (+) Transcript_33086:60-989(+)|eukprot:CAMPEP_0178439236 /NCGR_PEP_ID=MMETSP0689_2-20121128/36047_1 /TAXON_ID=160604 /ORGANISM="Amphidinium massartii, Strain CS-259" /LENGTH=309 /DNA_ID=CAMNT_0020061749 /DNA_START=237 /DNA_END=1169 /DNA_ORIENTATION=-
MTAACRSYMDLPWAVDYRFGLVAVSPGHLIQVPLRVDREIVPVLFTMSTVWPQQHNCELVVQKRASSKAKLPSSSAAGPTVLCSNHKMVLAAVKQSGLLLQYASDALRADREIVLAAVARHGLALEFASEALRAEREIVETAVARHGLALQFASEELRADRIIVSTAVSGNGTALRYASEVHRSDREIVISAVSSSPQALEAAQPEFTADPDVMELVRGSGASVWIFKVAMMSGRFCVLVHDNIDTVFKTDFLATAAERLGLNLSQMLRADLFLGASPVPDGCMAHWAREMVGQVIELQLVVTKYPLRF